MKKVIIAFDFTDQAASVIKFATNFFKEAKFTLVHVIPSNGLLNINYEELLATNNSRHWEVKIKEFIISETEWKFFPKDINIEILHGSVAFQLEQFAVENNFDSIVVGRRAHYSRASNWFGTHAYQLVKKSTKELYTVPNNYSQANFDKVLVASNSELEYPAAIEKLFNWTKEVNAFVSFLHVKENDKEDFDSSKESIVYHYLAQDEVTKGFDINVVPGIDVAKIILENAYQRKADMIVVFPSKNSLIKNVFLTSVSKELLENSALPIAFL